MAGRGAPVAVNGSISREPAHGNKHFLYPHAEKFQKRIRTFNRTPGMNAKLSPFAADALSQVRQIAIDGQKVGIIRLDESISEVMALNLTADADIQAALLQRIAQNNYIPPSAGGLCEIPDGGVLCGSHETEDEDGTEELFSNRSGLTIITASGRETRQNHRFCLSVRQMPPGPR